MTVQFLFLFWERGSLTVAALVCFASWDDRVEEAEKHFRIQSLRCVWPDFDVASTEPPLSVYFPAHRQCRQLNYGQGEGQVEIDGLEWGFYWNGHRDLSVILHDGALLSQDEAEQVVFDICSQLEGLLGGKFTFVPDVESF